MNTKQIKINNKSQIDIHDKTSKCHQSAIAKLKALGYGFNKDGVVCKFDKTTKRITDERFWYDYWSRKQNGQFDHILNEVLYELLESNGLKRTYIPEHLPPKKGSLLFTQPACLRKSKKLLVLISGYAGKWSSNAITETSIIHGSQLNYIRRAQALGYDLLIMNNFENHRLSCGKMEPIPELRTAARHAEYIWHHYVLPAEPESVAIIAAYGCGQIALTLAEIYSNFFKEKVFAIALMHSWYSIKKDVLENIGQRSCNWMIDYSSLNTEIPNTTKDLRVRHMSAGPNALNIGVPYVACKSVFRFLESKYVEYKNRDRKKV